MTDAFQCDFCKEFQNGTPAESLYIKEHMKGQSSASYHEKYHLCEECKKDIDAERSVDGS